MSGTVAAAGVTRGSHSIGCSTQPALKKRQAESHQRKAETHFELASVLAHFPESHRGQLGNRVRTFAVIIKCQPCAMWGSIMRVHGRYWLDQRGAIRIRARKGGMATAIAPEEVMRPTEACGRADRRRAHRHHRARLPARPAAAHSQLARGVDRCTGDVVHDDLSAHGDPPRPGPVLATMTVPVLCHTDTHCCEMAGQRRCAAPRASPISRFGQSNH